jgi:pimeloyl-ACP methyl ester carboxylesterase
MAQVAPQPYAPPSFLLAMSEGPRAALELGALPLSMPWLATAPAGDGHPVMVLPGFVTSDASTLTLRNYFTWLGYDTHAWGLGRNLGPRAIGHAGEKLLKRFDAIFEETNEKVSLVGWSLGGVMARQLARRRPDQVRQVITLGSPITGSPKETSVWRLYEMMSGQKIESPEIEAQVRESMQPIPVRSTAIYSKGDGVVAWQNCLEPKAENTENIEVYGSHCGLAFNPAVLYAAADRLSLIDAEWHPFDRSGFAKSFLYPAPNRPS